MTRTLVITSGKGGVGKTNIAVNTAIELARRHYRTCLFDADLGLANVNILLGIDPEYTLDAFLFGDKPLDQVILKTKYGIDIIPGSSGIEQTANLDREQISSLVDSLGQIKGYDFFLIDTSSGISQGVMAFCLAGNETVVVITSEATALTDAYALLKVMAHNNYGGTVKILVNKSPSIPQARETYLRFKEVVNRHLPLTIAPAGIILHDPNMERAISRQEPALLLYPDSLASQCIKATVANLLKTDPAIQPDGDLGTFWQRYFEFSLPDSQEGRPQPGTGSSNSQLVLPENDGKPRSTAPPGSPEAVSDHPETRAQSAAPATGCDLPSPQEMKACEISTLPSPVPLLTRALELQARGELTGDSLQAIICCDPTLLMQALKMIGRLKGDVRRSKRVIRRDQLMQELGEKALTDLLNTACMRTALSEPLPAETAELTGNFWRHSYRCAVLAEVIAEITAYPWPEEAYIAGLIHDIGRLALQTGHPEAYRQFPKTFGHLEPVITMEQQVFRRTHAEIGAATLRAWHLDGLLADAVQYHTESFTRIETAFNLVKIVSLASRLCDSQEPEAEALAAALFGFTSSQVHNLQVVAGDRVRRFGARYQLDLAQETDVDRPEPAPSRFREQAMDYSIMLGVLPNTAPVGQLPETIRSIFQAFHVVFSLQPGFCLIPDRRHSLLQARGYPDCFCWESLADIQFSLHWHNSLMVTAFLSGEVQTAIDEESGDTLPLADRQLLRSLGSEGLVCVPMVAHGQSRGVIVFGIDRKQLDTIRSLGHRLAQFGVQAARNIYRLERTETGHLISGNSF